MGKVSEKIKEEFLAMIPPTVFFFFTLGLVAVVRTLMTKGTGLPISAPLQVAVGALILGKAVLIADLLPIINRYPDKPLAERQPTPLRDQDVSSHCARSPHRANAIAWRNWVSMPWQRFRLGFGRSGMSAPENLWKQERPSATGR